MIVNNRFRQSHSVINSWQHPQYDDGWALLTTAGVWCHVEQEAGLIFKHIFIWNQNISPRGESGMIWMRQHNQWCLLPNSVPYRWNSLPLETRACSSLLTFRREIKSHLFRQSYGWRGAVYSDGQQTSALSCATVLNLDFCKVHP